MLVAIRLDEDVVEEIRARAKAEGKTNSAIIRSFFNKPLLPPTPQPTQPIPTPIPIVNGEVDYDLHEECCIEFIASGARKICEHWKPHRTPWGELQFVHEITGKKSNEYEEDGTWSPY